MGPYEPMVQLIGTRFPMAYTNQVDSAHFFFRVVESE